MAQISTIKQSLYIVHRCMHEVRSNQFSNLVFFFSLANKCSRFKMWYNFEWNSLIKFIFSTHSSSVRRCHSILTNDMWKIELIKSYLLPNIESSNDTINTRLTKVPIKPYNNKRLLKKWEHTTEWSERSRWIEKPYTWNQEVKLLGVRCVLDRKEHCSKV